MTEDRLSRHDLGAEGAALAAAFIDPATAGRVLEVVKQDDLHPKHHRHLGLITTLFERDGRCDLVAAGAEAGKFGLTFNELSTFADEAADAGALELHLRTIKKLSKVRRAARALVQAQQKVDDDPEAALAGTLEALQAKDGGEADPVENLYRKLDDATSGRRHTILTPWPVMGRETQLLTPGFISLICGTAGSTKSFAVVQALRMWVEAGVLVAALMLEDGIEFHLRRALAQMAGLAGLTNDEWCHLHPDEVHRAKERHNSALKGIEKALDSPRDGERLTPDTLLAWMRRRALAGAKVLVVDPVSALERGATPWAQDEKFLWGAKRIAETHEITVVLVTHPKSVLSNGAKKPMTLNDLSGGYCYQKFSQCVLNLEAHKSEPVMVYTSAGRIEVEADRTWTCFKSRNGPARGNTYAAFFDPATLTLKELGRRVD